MKHTTRVALILSSVSLVLLFCYGLLSMSPYHLPRFVSNLYEAKHDGKSRVLPIFTPGPRLEEKMARELITELFKTNGGCRLPCWWEIVPGKTSWLEAHAFLASFMPEAVPMRYLQDDGRMFFDGIYGDIGDNGSMGIEISMAVIDDTTPVKKILITQIPPKYLSNLTLSKIFQSYGMPGGIYIRHPYEKSVPSSRIGMFELYIYYPDKFIAKYVYDGYKLDETIQVCSLDRPTFADFHVWEPSLFPDFQKASETGYWSWDYKGLPLNEQTTWTIETLYKAVVSAEGQAVCIESQPVDKNGHPYQHQTK